MWCKSTGVVVCSGMLWGVVSGTAWTVSLDGHICVPRRYSMRMLRGGTGVACRPAGRAGSVQETSADRPGDF